MWQVDLPRPLYVVLRFGEMLVSVLSRLLNAAVLGGSTHQTTSARAHIETSSARAHIETSSGWRFGRRLINVLFFWQRDHCKWAWEQEVANARKTLQRAGAIEVEAGAD